MTTRWSSAGNDGGGSDDKMELTPGMTAEGVTAEEMTGIRFDVGI